MSVCVGMPKVDQCEILLCLIHILRSFISDTRIWLSFPGVQLGAVRYLTTIMLFFDALALCNVLGLVNSCGVLNADHSSILSCPF